MMGRWILATQPPREERNRRAHWFVRATDTVSACGMMRRAADGSDLEVAAQLETCRRRKQPTCASCRLLYAQAHAHLARKQMEGC